MLLVHKFSIQLIDVEKEHSNRLDQCKAISEYITRLYERGRKKDNLGTYNNTDAETVTSEAKDDSSNTEQLSEVHAVTSKSRRYDKSEAKQINPSKTCFYCDELNGQGHLTTITRFGKRVITNGCQTWLKMKRVAREKKIKKTCYLWNNCGEYYTKPHLNDKKN